MGYRWPLLFLPGDLPCAPRARGLHLSREDWERLQKVAVGQVSCGFRHPAGRAAAVGAGLGFLSPLLYGHGWLCRDFPSGASPREALLCIREPEARQEQVAGTFTGRDRPRARRTALPTGVGLATPAPGAEEAGGAALCADGGQQAQAGHVGNVLGPPQRPAGRGLRAGQRAGLEVGQGGRAEQEEEDRVRGRT